MVLSKQNQGIPQEYTTHVVTMEMGGENVTYIFPHAFWDITESYLFSNPGANLVVTYNCYLCFCLLSHEDPMFCDVPRSSLHFLRNRGFHRHGTFKNVSYI